MLCPRAANFLGAAPDVNITAPNSLKMESAPDDKILDSSVKVNSDQIVASRDLNIKGLNFYILSRIYDICSISTYTTLYRHDFKNNFSCQKVKTKSNNLIHK